MKNFKRRRKKEVVDFLRTITKTDDFSDGYTDM